ncbi:MAG: 23S rRNA (uracil(1939)-C(5))-methyltransferase RlmD [Thermovirgaceae bacterium]
MRKMQNGRATKPSTGESVIVDVTAVNSRGEGVARYGKDHFVLFAAETLPGERVQGRVTLVKKNYGILKVEKILEPSPDRRDPKCPWFGICGGCSFQHADYDLQCSLKKRSVQDALMKELGPEFPLLVEDCIKSPALWNYRNKASFPVRSAGKTTLFGFFRRDSHYLVPVDTCPVLQKPLQEALKELPFMIDLLGWQGYDERKHAGFLRHISLRVTKAEALSLVFVVREPLKNEKRKDLDRLCDFLRGRKGSGLPSVFVNVNSKPGNRIFGHKTFHIAGPDCVEERVGNHRLKFGPTSFFQVNPFLAERLFETALSGFDRGKKIVELYSGVGAMTLGLAEKASHLYACESWPEAASYLEANLGENGFPKARVIPQAAEEALEAIKPEDCEALLIDPPRTGCSVEVRRKILSLRPDRIVYVSCNPATLARDLGTFVAGKYRILRVVPLDMFPQTPHVETITFLSL